jgi:hypothetical protein
MQEQPEDRPKHRNKPPLRDVEAEEEHEEEHNHLRAKLGKAKAEPEAMTHSSSCRTRS